MSSSPTMELVLLAVVLGVLLLASAAVVFARFYKRCGADEALVRTGAGGNKVVIGGGITVYPILHQLMRVSLRSIKLSVEREGHNALVTKDKIKANVTTELYIKVEPLTEDVLAAARSFGERNLDEAAIGDLIEGKLTDALRSVAANQTFMDLHSKRKEFAEQIQNTLAEELTKNGLTLENVSITALAMVPVKELDAHDVFDAEGLRAITESVQTNAEKTNQIQREKENAIKTQNVEARKYSLSLEQAQAEAEADQARRVAEYRATQSAETAKAVYIQEQAQQLASYEKDKATETARIAREQAVAIAEAQRMGAENEARIAAEKSQKVADIAKQRTLEAAMIEKDKIVQAAEIDRQTSLEAATIEKQKVVGAAEIAKEQAVETARIQKEIAVIQSEEQAARAAALKAQAQAEEEQQTQAIKTVEETARANREKAIAIIKAEETAQQSRIAADREAYRIKLEAEAKAAAVRAEAQAEADRVRIAAEARATAAVQEANALKSLAEATLKKGEAEAEARRKSVEAENQVNPRLLLRDVSIKALEVLPEVVHELMTPAKAISEIKVLQLQGMNGGAAGDRDGAGAFGSASPVLKTILEAGAAYPLMREMLQFSQADTAGLADKARGLLGALPPELKRIIDEDPELAAKVAGLGAAPSDEGAGANGAHAQG